MKWINRGSEFDKMYQNISSKNKFYLFGAGDYGRQFINAISNENNIIGFIDNDKNKLNNKVLKCPCFSTSTICNLKCAYCLDFNPFAENVI